LTRFFLFIMTLATMVAAHADVGDWLAAGNTLQSIQKGLAGRPTPEGLKQWLTESTGIANNARQCVAREQKNLDAVQQDMAVLGPVVAGEPPTLAKLRDHLQKQQQHVNSQLATCRLLTVQSTELKRRVQNEQDRIHTAALLHHGPNLFQGGAALLSTAPFANPFRQSWWRGLGGRTALGSADMQWCLGLGLAAFVIAWGWRRRQRSRQPPPTMLRGYGSAWQAALGRYLPLLSGAGAATAYLEIQGATEQWPWALCMGILSYAAGAALLYLILAPSHPLPRQLDWPPRISRSLLLELRGVLLLVILNFLANWALPGGSLADLGGQVVRPLFQVAILILLLRVLWNLGTVRPFAAWSFPRIVAGLAIIATALVEFSGYEALAAFLFRGISLTLLAIGLGLILNLLLRDGILRMSNNDGAWKQLLRRRLGLTTEQNLPGTLWLCGLLYFILWILVGAGILHAWGLSGNGFGILWAQFSAGFTVGGFHLAPLRLLLALLIFLLLLNVNAWVQQRLGKHPLFMDRLASGERHSILTIIRYVGVIITLLVALAVAGINLRNLAIIAGALSVGIGFGLQNIVNNFVSGLILLFERPIRVGDWVAVGKTEGYVQRISIRYTLILTFDRTEVFVPNSEMISGQVTNWTYSNSVLRLMIPVQVSQDSDVVLVMRVLEEVGRHHPDVLQDDPRGIPPTALFLNVDENALRFALRVYLEDGNKSFNVQTELRTKMVESLRQHGIALAHQQQDVHIISARTHPSPFRQPEITPGMPDPKGG